MKIGIVTIFDSENFGNQLQNYALHWILQEYGAEVITIKNKPRFRSFGAFLRRGTPLAESILLNRLTGKGRKANILAFRRKYIPTTRRCHCCGSSGLALKGEARRDLYCVGSDQVWNPELGRTGGFSFLDFAGGRAFSYAASFGVDQIPMEHRENFRRWLGAIPHLSLREDRGRELVKDLTRRQDAVVHIDPTLLLTKADWENLMEKPRGKLPKDYLLLYFLGDLSPKQRKAIQENAAGRGLSILDILDPDCPFYEIGPGEFLYLLGHAAQVYTDSYHAGVFSFLFQRPLALFDRGTMDSRLDTFTRTFRLEACRVRGDALPEQPGDSQSLAILEAERKRARAYLQSVLEGAVPL